MSDFAQSLQQALGPGYRVLRELGGGGMSRVYLAEEVALDRRVVVKVLPPELAEGVTSGRFRREIQLAAQLQHPHIVPLLSSGTAGGLLYYVMPYVEGETLRARLARDGAQTAPEAACVARDVVEALTYAHSQGVVHRDIKPENILLSSGHALVLDFGVAKALRAAVEPGHGTTAGVALGTPVYMSPEQAAGGDVDERADLYAVGVVLYELLAGRPPFQSDSAYDVMAAHIADRPDPLRKHRRDVPPELEAVVMRCLAKRAADRFRTAGALLAELDAFATPASGRIARGRGRVRGRLAEAERHQAEAIRARAAGESGQGLVSLQREIIRAGHDILIRRGAAEGVRRLDAALRITPLDSLSPARRPYLAIGYQYAVAGHAAAARRTLGERVRDLRRLGRGGAAILLRDGHEPQPLVVQGRIDAAEGRLDEALALLRRAESRRETLVALPDLGAVHDQAGQADSAIAAYERYLAQGWLARHETDGWHLPRILFRLGELYETRGDRVRAADYYSQFAQLWRECDPDLQPRVREARRRLAALTTEAGSR